MAAMGKAAAGANGRLRPQDDAPAMLTVIDDLELGLRLDPGPSRARRNEAVEKRPTATVQLEGPGGCPGPNLHMDEV